MAFNIFTNIPCTDGVGFLYNLKNFLTLSGSWIAVSSSTGTVTGSGDVITFSGTNTATGMNNAGAWYQLRSPGGKDLIVQRNTAATQASIWYAGPAGAQFQTVPTSALLPPTASTNARLLITGTNTWLPNSNPSMWFDIWVGDATEDYSFFAMGRTASQPNMRWFFGMEVLAETSSFDQDPYLFHCYGASSMDFIPGQSSGFFNAANASAGSSSVAASGWYRFGLSSPAFVKFVPLAPITTTRTNASAQTFEILTKAPTKSIFEPDKIDTFPVYYARTTSTMITSTGIKGRSKYFKVHANVDFGSTTTAQDRFFMNNASLPWNTSSTWRP